jgi:hypothetical protein
MTNREMQDSGRENINPERRRILQSGSALGAGIITPATILGSGLFLAEPAAAATESVQGSLVQNKNHPIITTILGGKEYRITAWHVKRNGSIIENVVTVVQGSSTQVIRRHTLNSKTTHTHYTAVSTSTTHVTFWNPSARRLTHTSNNELWSRDHDMDGTYADPISTYPMSVGSLHNKTVDFTDPAESYRYIQGARKNTSTSNVFVNKGLVVTGHNDPTDERTWAATSLFGNKSQQSKFTSLLGLYSDIASAKEFADKATNRRSIYVSLSGVAVVVATGLAFIDPTKIAAVSVGILAVGFASLGQASDEVAMKATHDLGVAQVKYRNFVVSNAAETGTW